MLVNEEKWHIRFLRVAKEVASWSHDPSTKVGCVLVRDRRIISTGYNGFSRGIEDKLERLNDREFKYAAIIHAEKNALLSAALHGVTTQDSDCYVTLYPCSQCAASLINAGIKNVYVPGDVEIPDRWLENFILALGLFREAGVNFLTIDIS
jgi:dCMP deaminase